METSPLRQHRPTHSSVPLGVGAAKTAPVDRHEALVEQTRIWVSQTFFGQLLKQMRNSPFKTELSGGGAGGQTFGTLFDQHLAERMGRGAGEKLVQAIVRKIESRNDTYTPAGAGSPSTETAGRHVSTTG